MSLVLPDFVASAYVDELQSTRTSYRQMARTKDSPVRIDPWLCERMATAIDDGLPCLETCAPEDYRGPHASLVHRMARTGANSIEVEHPDGRVSRQWRDGLARSVVDQLSRDHPEALWLHWLSAADGVLPAQNDACEAEFAPIVLADPRDVRWFVAASVYTWATSGVWTPPILRESLARLAARASGIVDAWRAFLNDRDPHMRWMATHAVQVIDGRWASNSTWQELDARYAALLRASAA